MPHTRASAPARWVSRGTKYRRIDGRAFRDSGRRSPAVDAPARIHPAPFSIIMESQHCCSGWSSAPVVSNRSVGGGAIGAGRGKLVMSSEIASGCVSLLFALVTWCGGQGPDRHLSRVCGQGVAQSQHLLRRATDDAGGKRGIVDGVSHDFLLCTAALAGGVTRSEPPHRAPQTRDPRPTGPAVYLQDRHRRGVTGLSARLWGMVDGVSNSDAGGPCNAGGGEALVISE